MNKKSRFAYFLKNSTIWTMKSESAYEANTVRSQTARVQHILKMTTPITFFARKQLLLSAIAILSVRPSVCPSVTRVDQSKAVQARITKFSLSAAQKTSFRNRKAFP